MPAPGARFGPYELLDPIGSGGMGEVFRARDTRLDRIVAIKFSKEQFSVRFENEARSVAALNHPHICQLYDVGPNYLVMEFVEGAQLKGPLPIEKAIDYASQILDALDAAHKKGITHRDLKPANILVTKQGIKLLDFGLAKKKDALTESDATQALTTQGQIVGTLQYMSPEQLQSKEVDPRSDLFSFGCVLYEMLTGKRAFEGQSAASVIAAILERDPAPITVAPTLERIVKRSLAKDPDQRFQTARDLKAALNWAMEHQPAHAPVRRWHWPVTAALILIAALAGWAIAHFRQSPPDDRVISLQIDPPENGRFVFGVSAGGVALSPDGKTAAYVASSNGKTGLWIRPLDSTIARLLPGTEGASYPFWSPDNKSIAFFTSTKLERVDLNAGSPTVICDAAIARGGEWSSDGSILYSTVNSGLFRVPASGGKPSVLTTLGSAPNEESSHRWPQVLPDGYFLYWSQSDKRENTGVYAASFAKPAERVRLLTTDNNALYARGNDGKSYLLWLRGRTLFAQEFDAGAIKLVGEPHALADPVAGISQTGQMNSAVSATGILLYSDSNPTSQLTWFDRSGKSLGVVGEEGEYSTFRLSRDGRRAVVSRDGPGVTDLLLVETERGVFSRFTSNTGTNIIPVWSSDGRTIVFSSGNTRNLFRKEPSAAANEERITRSPSTQGATDWSRDGRFVLYFEIDSHSRTRLWILPVTLDGKPLAGSAPRLYLSTPFSEWWGTFSPEPSPRWVAYQSNESGRWEVYVQSFPEPRGETRISTGGGQFPQWGPDGRELFYVSPDYKLMAVNVKLGADSVQPSAPRELFSLPATEAVYSPFEVAPDGRRFLVRANAPRAARSLTVIVNWPALLKKSAAAP